MNNTFLTSLAATAVLAVCGTGVADAAKRADTTKPTRTKSAQVSKRNAAAARTARTNGAPTVTVGGATVVMGLEAGSAGVPGYDDSACESLASKYEHALSVMEEALASGDDKRSAEFADRAEALGDALTDNCLVVY